MQGQQNKISRSELDFDVCVCVCVCLCVCVRARVLIAEMIWYLKPMIQFSFGLNVRNCQSYFMRLLPGKTDGHTSMARICWDLTLLFVKVWFFVVRKNLLIQCYPFFTWGFCRCFFSDFHKYEWAMREIVTEISRGQVLLENYMCRWNINSKADWKTICADGILTVRLIGKLYVQMGY